MTDVNQEVVLVIPRAKLFIEEAGRPEFQGFTTEIEGYQNLFTDTNLLYRPRSVVETEPQYKQLIPYLFFTQGDKVLAYQRTKKGGESRLHSKWSVGFGGHMNDGDHDFEAAIRREREEELDFDFSGLQGRIVGLLNDDSNEVGQVHLGVVFQTKIPQGTPKPTQDEGLSNIGWYTRDFLLSQELENWSRLLLEAV